MIVAVLHGKTRCEAAPQDPSVIVTRGKASRVRGCGCSLAKLVASLFGRLD